MVAFAALLINPPTGTEQIGRLGFNKPPPARRQSRGAGDPPHLSLAERGGRGIYYWNFVSVGGLPLKRPVQQLFSERRDNVEQSRLIGNDRIPKEKTKTGRKKSRHFERIQQLVSIINRLKI